MSGVDSASAIVPFPRRKINDLPAGTPNEHHISKIRKYLAVIIRPVHTQRRRKLQDLHILLDLLSHVYDCLELAIRFCIQNISRPEAHRTAAVNRAELLLVPLDVEQAVVHLLCVQLPALELVP